MESVRLRPELRFNSQDCYVLDLRWDAESRTPESPQAAQTFEWTARLINPRGKPYEPNFWLIEMHTRLLRDVALGKVDGPEQVLLEAFFTPGRLNKWPQFVALGRDGKLNGETRFEQKQVTVAAASLARHGYVALFPNYWYCPALFAADDGNYVARIGNAYGGNLLLGVESPGAVLKAGIELRHRFVYAVVAGQDTSEAAFERIHRAYGFAGGPTYDLRLERGVVLEKTFALTLKADRYAVRGSLESPNLPSCLLVVMEDLCPNWDAGVFDLKTKQLRRFGTLEGRGYFTLDGRAARHFAAGNLIVCDHREVRLHLTRNADGWVVVAHNPTDTALETTVAVPDWLALLPAASRKVALPPGGTVTIALTR
ncbi:MAG: hypothetical protein FJ279_07110 [Planctomycetes bacterium]|nr:hypothetical protein [Planctomycetota bacterium]